MATSFPKDKLKVVLLEGIHQSAVDTFKSAGYTNLVHLPSALPQKELIETIKDAHGGRPISYPHSGTCP